MCVYKQASVNKHLLQPLSSKVLLNAVNSTVDVYLRF